MSAESVASSDHTLPGPDAGARYTPHRPEQTLLHRTIREQLEGFLARSAERGHPVPRFVEQELRAFVRATPPCAGWHDGWGESTAWCGWRERTRQGVHRSRPGASLRGIGSLERARALEVEAAAPQPIVKGRHLLHLGLRPGPELGSILRDCYAAQLEGEFSTLEEGIEYARRRWGVGSGDGAEPS